MLRAFKSWTLNHSHSSASFRGATGEGPGRPYPTFTPTHSSTFRNEECGTQIFEEEMNTYGNLLLCPLCQELFTHPVLLPCQHSLCYGCARAQLLTAFVEDGEMSHSNTTLHSGCAPSDTPAHITAASDTPAHITAASDTQAHITAASDTQAHMNRSFTFASDTQPSAESVTTLSSNSGRRMDEEEKRPFLFVNKECLPFEQSVSISASLTPRNSATKLCSPTLSSPPYHSKSATPSIPPRPKTASLRRSNSTSSVLRVATTRSRSQQIYGTLKRSKVKRLFCPNCREMVELGNRGISGLFRNFALEAIVERFRSKAKAAIAIRCGFCKPPATVATRLCLDCKLSYCNECFKVVHVWGTKKAKHSFVGPTNSFTRPKVLLCPEHSNEVSFYCNKCKKSVCRLCRSGRGAHVNHSVSSAKIACREGKKRLSIGLQKLKGKKEEVDARMKMLTDACRECERLEVETRELIHSSLDEIFQLLEVKRRELLNRVEAKFRINEEYLGQELQCHHQRLMATSISNFIEEVLKENDPIFFLQTSQMVERKLEEVLRSLSEIDQSDVIITPSAPHLDLDGLKLHLEELNLKETGKLSGGTGSSDSQKQDVRWVVPKPTRGVHVEENGRTVIVSVTCPRPCVLIGNLTCSWGEHSWQVHLNSSGARRILVGVSGAGVAFHDWETIERNGAFLEILPGALFSLNNRQAAGGASAETSKRAVVSIGKHSYTIRVYLRVFDCDAVVHFYDASTDESNIELFCKSFERPGPLQPFVLVDGEAAISLS